MLKLLEENTGSASRDADVTGSASQDVCNFLSRSPFAQELRPMIDRWYFIKLKSFCTAKETINGIKMKPIEWERIFARYTSDGGSIFRIFKEHTRNPKSKK